MNPLQVRNQYVHFEESGSGEPLLLLHGNPDTSAMWQPLVAQLDGHYRCIAPDLPGFGRSAGPVPETDVSLDGMAQWVDELVNRLQLPTPLTLVVHDFGGVYGLAWAARHPEKVKHLVITNTLFHSDYQWHFWARVWRTPLLGELSMVLLAVPVLGWQLLRLSMAMGSKRLSRAQMHEAYAALGPATRKMVLHLYRASDPENFVRWEDQMLTACRKIQTQVIWGAHDPYIDTAYAQRFGARQVDVIDSAGHWVAAEAPVETARCILAFAASRQ